MNARPGRQDYYASLEALRLEIDAIDDELLDLLNCRARIVHRIYALKDGNGVPRLDRGRTAEMLLRLIAHNGGPLSSGEVRRLFEGVLAVFVQRSGRQRNA
jgi:chorismate mutase